MSRSTALPRAITPLLEEIAATRGKIMVLTGSGVSAESGVPSFRGKEGYWRVGSTNYHPADLATHEAFLQMPDEVWAWYLYRRSLCQAAAPNAAHDAIAELEFAAKDRFILATESSDGLHLRAGNSDERTYQLHGNLNFMRCTEECTREPLLIPPEVDLRWEKGRSLTDADREYLVCPACRSATRPHVLWFDEAYDEQLYRFESTLAAAANTDLLLVVGTTGSTNLPRQIGAEVSRRIRPMIIVDLERNPFADFGDHNPLSVFVAGKASEIVPELVAQIACYV